MPAALVPLLSVIVSAAGVGTSVYEGIHSSNENAANQAQQKALLAQQQKAAANQANLTKQEAVMGAQGQAQQQTGGSLTDPGTSAFESLLAGYPGFHGGSAAATPASEATSPSSSVSAILAALQGQGNGTGLGSGTQSGANISGGNWQPTQSQPENGFKLSGPVLG